MIPIMRDVKNFSKLAWLPKWLVKNNSPDQTIFIGLAMDMVDFFSIELPCGISLEMFMALVLHQLIQKVLVEDYNYFPKFIHLPQFSFNYPITIFWVMLPLFMGLPFS